MNFNNPPPSYEDSLIENKIFFYFNENSNEPYNIYYGEKFLIADFLPWSEMYSSADDVNNLLLRVNSWLKMYNQYRVHKCEFIPRMIDSRKKLDLTKCYIFNLTNGRTYFVNQLRLHISIDKSKTQSDQIHIKSYIPEIKKENSINILNINSSILRFHFHDNSHVYEDMSSLIDKINIDIKKGVISGVITNISTFYWKIKNDKCSPSVYQSMDDTLFYNDSSESRCHLKCLRVFYKPGDAINGTLALKTFITDNKLKRLDQLIENAIAVISNMETQHFISMETFSEFEEESQYAIKKNIINNNSSFVVGDRFIRLESVKIYFLNETQSFSKPLQNISEPLKIVWITPRKPRKFFESYNDFMEYVNYAISIYDGNIIDMETLYFPNSLSWSQVRHQDVVRYHSENCSNYQIFAIKFIIKNCHDSFTKNFPGHFNKAFDNSAVFLNL